MSVRIDAHQHFWKYDANRHAWITDAMATIRRDFLPADLVPLLDAARIDVTVAVEAHSSEAETDFLLALANETSRIRGVVGWVDLLASDLDHRLSRWSDATPLKGFRHAAQSEPNDFLARPEIARGVTQLGARGYAFDLLIYPSQLAAAERLVAACPDVRFVLDHCAKPNIARGEIDEWRSGIDRLARHPHVACKVSGLVTEASWRSWTFDDLVPYLDAVMDAFSPGRTMFGSDWPVCLVASEYARWVDVVERYAQRLTAAERDALFGGTAMTIYRLEV